VSLGHQHLAAVDERIRQLQAFRDQLASELAKWGGKQSAGSGESASRTSLGCRFAPDQSCEFRCFSWVSR
jgi:hypothetical protein